MAYDGNSSAALSSIRTREITKAMHHKQNGAEIAIVSERQWTDALKDASR